RWEPGQAEAEEITHWRAAPLRSIDGTGWKHVWKAWRHRRRPRFRTGILPTAPAAGGAAAARPRFRRCSRHQAERGGAPSGCDVTPGGRAAAGGPQAGGPRAVGKLLRHEEPGLLGADRHDRPV